MNNKEFLKKEKKLYSLMIEGLDETIKGLDDINESLTFLKANVNDLPNENGTIKGETLKKKFDDFNESLQELQVVRRQIKKSLEDTNKKIGNEAYKREKVDVDQFIYLQKRSQTFIDLLASSLELLKPIKTSVEELHMASRECLDNRDKYTSAFCEIMDNICTNSYSAQMRINQVSKGIKISVEKGLLHDVVMADSFLKADIELLKKEAKKR